MIRNGQNVRIRRTIRRERMNGHTSFRNSLIGQPVIPQVVNIMDPNGGVIPPIMIFTIATRPKW